MNTTSIIIGNICSILAMITDSVSSTRKTARGVLLVQTLSQAIYFTGTVILKGYSGAVQNAVSIIRNLVAVKIESKALEWGLVALGVVLGICFNNRGWMGLLPVISHLQYSIAIFKFKDNERALKLSFAVAVGLYAVFNIVLLNVVGVCTNATVMVTTLVMLLRKQGVSEKQPEAAK